MILTPCIYVTEELDILQLTATHEVEIWNCHPRIHAYIHCVSMFRVMMGANPKRKSKKTKLLISR